MGSQYENDISNKLQINEIYNFPVNVKFIRLTIEWITPKGILCDLDVCVYLYDDRARYLGKLDYTVMQSNDKSTSLEADKTLGRTTGSHEEVVRIEFDHVDKSTAAILLFLDGRPRNFQSVQNVILKCTLEDKATSEASSLFQPAGTGDRTSNNLFDVVARTRKDSQGVALCLLYKDYPKGSEDCSWFIKCFMETVTMTHTREKMAHCLSLVVENVPMLDEYRPRQFPTVRALCSALSSHALPQLKHKFLRMDGLPIEQFTRVVFRQLVHSHPSISSGREAPFTVAMLQEMFHQIDYNGDGTVDWDEFTTFCIQNVQSQQGAGLGPGAHYSQNSDAVALDQFAIEYLENAADRDKALSSYSQILSLRQIPESRRLLVVPEDSDTILLFDTDLSPITTISPNFVKGGINMSKGGRGGKEGGEGGHIKHAASVSADARARVVIYDAVFLSGRDMYAFTASDHAITICKEQSSAGGRTTHFHVFNKLFHSILQIKLCWSQRSRILCSVGTDRIIFGWDIDTSKVVFKVTRHEDVITDFHALDEIEMFATCGLDKRIVLWNMNTRRVKGVLLGHTRGVRSISYSSGLLLSASFECDARVWDVNSKDVLLYLRGHRAPVAAGKLMCERAQSDEEFRAVTVDDTGEFRVWDVFVKERGSDPHYAPTLQVFTMQNPEPALNRFRFLVLPYHNSLSQGNYSNILLHFLPRKNVRDFQICSCFLFDEFNAVLLTAVGRNLMKYDITTGHFLEMFPDLHTTDLTALSMDGRRARRVYVGCNDGHVLLVNFMTGLVIDTVHAHSAEVTCLVAKGNSRHNLFSASVDGDLMMMEESSGTITIQRTFRKAFGTGVGVHLFFLLEGLNAMFVISNSKYWGVWNTTMFKRLMVFAEDTTVSAIQIVPSPGDKENQNFKLVARFNQPKTTLTVAVACLHSIHIYAVDILDRTKTFPLFDLKHENSTPLTFTAITLVNSPHRAGSSQSAAPHLPSTSFGSVVTQTTHRGSVQGQGSKGAGLTDPKPIRRALIASTDDGQILEWDVSNLRVSAKRNFKLRVSRQLSRSHILSRGASGKSRPSSQKGLGRFDTTPVTVAATETNGPNVHGFPLVTELSLDAVSGDSSDDDDEKTSRSSRGRASAKVKSRSKSSRRVSDMQSSNSLFESASEGAIASGPKTPTELFIAAVQDTEEEEENGGQNEGLEFIRMSSLLEDLDLEPLYLSGSWKAHVDSICGIVPLSEQSCFVTAAHDGYFRVWSMTGECFGEMPLPNLTDKMRSSYYKLNVAPPWKFMFDMVEIMDLHRELATKILLEDNMHQSEDLKREELGSGARIPRSKFHAHHHHQVGHHHSSSDHSHHTFALASSSDSVATGHSNTSNQASLRQQVLHALFEPHSIPEDAPPSRIMSPGTVSAMMEFSHHRTSPPRSPTSEKDGASIASHRASFSSAPSPNQSATLSHGAQHSLSYGVPNGGMNSQLSNTQDTVHSHQLNSLKEHSVFSNMGLWSAVNEGPLASALMTPAAFSDASLTNSGKDGLIDNEAHRILRRVAAESSRAKVYDRTMPTLLLRNPSLSTSVVIPSIKEIRTAEVHFGPQKDMYKNAEKYLNERANLSKRRARDVVTQARIKRNLHKIRSMIHEVPPIVHDEVSLSNTGAFGLMDEESAAAQKMQSRLQQSAVLAAASEVLPRELDRERLQRLAEKVSQAEKIAPPWEKNFIEATRTGTANLGLGGGRRLVGSSKASLEKKLYKSVCWKSQNDDGLRSSSKKAVLHKQDLGANYKMSDVKQFIEMFITVDEDGSGELNCEEWVRFFTSLNKSISVQDARVIFMEMDKDGSGSITLPELIPVTFDKANPQQQKQIEAYIEAKVKTSFMKNKNPDGLSEAELKRLFRCYDTSGLGFVSIGLIRERIKALQLPVNALVQAMDLLKDMEDDEMVNQVEFVHLLEPYSSS